MVAVCGHLDPLVCHLAGFGGEISGNVRLAQLESHAPVARQRHDSLHREVGIVGKMARKVIGAQLVFGVETECAQVSGPGGEGLPVAGGIAPVILVVTDGGGEDNHVASLLYRHVARVCLPLGDGICTEVVRREGFGPAARFGIIIVAVDHSLRQTRIVLKIERCSGI